VGRDTFHQTRLLKAPSNLALNTSREGAATASLVNLCQGLTTLTVRNFFLIANLNLPSSSLKPLSLVLSQQALLKVYSLLSYKLPLSIKRASVRCPWSFPFSRLNRPNSLSLSS